MKQKLWEQYALTVERRGEFSGGKAYYKSIEGFQVEAISNHQLLKEIKKLRKDFEERAEKGDFTFPEPSAEDGFTRRYVVREHEPYNGWVDAPSTHEHGVLSQNEAKLIVDALNEGKLIGGGHRYYGFFPANSQMIHVAD